MKSFGVSALIKRFGEEVLLSQQEIQQKTYAVIQPLLYKNKMYLGGKITPFGIRDDGHYLMIADIADKITDWGKVIVSNHAGKFSVKRAEVVSCGKDDLYIWAVITPCKEAVADDYEEYDRCA